MKKSVVMKIFLVILVSLMLIVTTNFVQAVDNTTGYQDLTNLTGNNSSGNNNTSNTNSANSNNNTSGNNTARNNTTSALNSANATNRTNTTNNTSTYNNTTLPHTGIGDSIPVAVLVVVFGVSAVYAYKKIKEYKNI